MWYKRAVLLVTYSWHDVITAAGNYCGKKKTISHGHSQRNFFSSFAVEQSFFKRDILCCNFLMSFMFCAQADEWLSLKCSQLIAVLLECRVNLPLSIFCVWLILGIWLRIIHHSQSVVLFRLGAWVIMCVIRNQSCLLNMLQIQHVKEAPPNAANMHHLQTVVLVGSRGCDSCSQFQVN